MKRKFVILSAFLSVLLLFSSFSVKANDVVFPAFPLPVEGKSSTHYLIFYSYANNKYYMLKPKDPVSIFVERDSPIDVIYFEDYLIGYEWKVGNSSWKKYIENETSTLAVYHDGPGRIDLLYSSFSLLYEDGTIFFQRAPIKESFLAQMRKVEMGATLTTLVSLVPLLMVLVVSFLAFRKALVWLLKVLHKA